MSEKRLTRRDFLKVSVITILGAALQACRPAAPGTPAAKKETPKAATPVAPAAKGEAPMLANLVKAGKLPALKERLPTDVQVVKPVEEVGQYGGTWRTVHSDPGMGNLKMKLYDPPVRWKPDYTGYEEGLAKKWEWSDDGKTITFYFRKGVKWSDGKPFTMEDLKFWWEDIATNTEQKIIREPWWSFAKGERMQVEWVDDYTVRFKFATPQWIMPYILAQGFWEWEPLMMPKHYLKDFVPKYNPKATWEQFDDKRKWWQNPDFPTLFAWRTVEYVAGQRVAFERNPYYWKVDTAGNQLPYIDRIESTEVKELETRLLQMAQGAYDATFRGSADPRHIALLREKAQAGGYRVLNWTNGAGGWPAWLINQDYVDDNYIRDLLRNPKFRQAISHALDRKRIIEVVWEGIGTAQQSTISPQAWHFQSPEGQKVFKEWAESYTAYDTKKANALLDEVGLSKKDAEGFRTRADGSKLEIIVDVTDWGLKEICVEAAQILEQQLEAVGLRTTLNAVYGTPESGVRQNEGKYMLRSCHASEVDIWTYPDWIFPTRNNRAWPRVGTWRQTGGKEGWAPDPGSPAARLLELYDKGLAEPDIEKRHRIVWDAIRIHINEGPFTLGAAGDQPMPVVVKNNFRNVPAHGILGPWAPGSPGNTHPEQYFFKK